MRRIEISLPLPPPSASPNAHAVWRQRHREVKAYRFVCEQCIRAACAGITLPLQSVRVHLHFYLCRPPKGNLLQGWGGVYHAGQMYFPRDEDNARASAKAAQDALKDAGVIVGDGKKHVTLGETRLYSTAKEHQGLTGLLLIVEEIPPKA